MNLFVHRALPAMCLLAAVQVHAAGSLLRIVCDGDDANAEITINGIFKGECPLDVQVPAGNVKVSALKRAGPGREQRFVQEIRIGDGVIKRLEIQLGAAQFTAEGQKQEDLRLAREREAQEQAAAEKQRNDELAQEAARAKLDQQVDQMLAARRAQRPAGAVPEDCPDCPMMVVLPQAPFTLPQTADAETNRWIKEIEPELNSYRANQAETLKLPSSVIPWPCAKARSAVWKLSGFSSLADATPEQQESYRRQLGASATYYVRDVHFWPVRAACQNGELDGDVEVWAFGVLVSDTAQFLSVTPTLKRLRFNASAGKLNGLMRSVSRTGTAITDYRNAATNEMMRKNGTLKMESVAFSITQPLLKENARAVVVVNSTFADKTYQDTVEGPNTMISLPLGAGRSEQLHFSGARKSMRVPMKDGKMHGQTTVFENRIRTGAFVPDLKIPESTQCWKNGVLVKIDPCVVD